MFEALSRWTLAGAMITGILPPKASDGSFHGIAKRAGREFRTHSLAEPVPMRTVFNGRVAPGLESGFYRYCDRRQTEGRSEDPLCAAGSGNGFMLGGSRNRRGLLSCYRILEGLRPTGCRSEQYDETAKSDLHCGTHSAIQRPFARPFANRLIVRAGSLVVSPNPNLLTQRLEEIAYNAASMRSFSWETNVSGRNPFIRLDTWPCLSRITVVGIPVTWSRRAKPSS
jgi:hypothetical protein